MTFPKLLLSAGAGVVLAVLATIGGTPAHAAGACLTMPLVFETMTLEGCPSEASLDKAMDASLQVGPQSPETGKPDGLTLTSPDDDSAKRMVHTCRGYQQAMREGWFAMTQFDMNIEGFMRVACGSVLALQESKMATHSQFEAEAVDFRTLSLLPPNILGVISPDAEDTLKLLRDASFSVANMVATGDVLTRSGGDDQLELAYNHIASTFAEIGRGDFNGDGNMDLLLYARHEAIGGTLRWYELFGLAYLPGELTYERFEPAGLERLAPAP